MKFSIVILNYALQPHSNGSLSLEFRNQDFVCISYLVYVVNISLFDPSLFKPLTLQREEQRSLSSTL
jgi:hypothetical protein